MEQTANKLSGKICNLEVEGTQNPQNRWASMNVQSIPAPYTFWDKSSSRICFDNFILLFWSIVFKQTKQKREVK